MGTKHQIGLAGATSYVVGCIIGSGIFITPKGILENTGSVGLSLIVWVFCGLLSLNGGLCYTELATSIKKSGADFAYICHVGWYPVAFVFLWSSAVIYEPCELAIMSKTFAEYVVNAIPSVDCSPHRGALNTLFALLIMYFLICLNFFRLDRMATWMQIISTVAKVLALLIIIVVGLVWLGQGKTESLRGNMFQGTTTNPGSVVIAIYSGLWSYAGWETLNFGMEEIKNPRRNVPIAVLLGTSLTILIFVLTNVAYFAVLGSDGILESVAVAQTFGERTAKFLAYSMPVIVGITVAGSFNADIFTASRVYFTGSRQGQLPSFLSLLHCTQKTPQPALLFMAIFATIMIQVPSIETLINCVMFLQWIQRACAVSALIWIKWRKLPVDTDAVKFPLPFHVLFVVICLFLVVVPIYQTPVVSGIGVGVVLSAIPVYVFLVRPQKLPPILTRIDGGLRHFCQILLYCEPDWDFIPSENTSMNAVHPQVAEKKQYSSMQETKSHRN